MSEKKAVRANIRGVVQGVFFRKATIDAARQIGVAGWVRNKPDGSVEAFIEGNAGKVDKLVQWCRKGPPMATVQDINVSEETYTGEHTDFTVKHS